MIRARFIIESQSNKKSLAENFLKRSIEVMKQVKGVKIYDEHWEPTEKLDSGLYSSLVDLGLEIPDFETFFALLLGFAPSAVVIEEPEKLEVKAFELQNVANDVVTMLHNFAQANLELRLKASALAKKLMELKKT